MEEKTYIQIALPDGTKLGKYIRLMRGSHRTMAQFAREIGTSASTICRIENGRINRPLTEKMIYAIYNCKVKESNINFEMLMSANGFVNKEIASKQCYLEELKTGYVAESLRRKQIKSIIVSAMIEETGSAIPVAKKATQLTDYFQYAFFMDQPEEALQKMWCFVAFPEECSEKIPPKRLLSYIQGKMANVLLLDAWHAERLDGIKFSFVFCDQMLYTEIVQSLKNAPIKSAMSAILVDTNNKKVLEETWISSIFKEKEYEAFPQIVSKKRQEEEMDYERDCSYDGWF